jgi:hypothetical protein
MKSGRKPPFQSDESYTAVIGDMLASRALQGRQRLRVQTEFNDFVALMNRRYKAALVSEFAITLGDEFQCILADPTVLPDIIWDISRADRFPQLRLGIGFGRIDTLIPRQAINLDGPALHNARTAIEKAKSDKLLGGVFHGFGDTIDTVANGIARLLRFHISKRSETQLRVLDLLRSGHTQIEIAKKIGRTPQAVSDHKNAAGWEAYEAGERALRQILRIDKPAGVP